MQTVYFVLLAAMAIVFLIWVVVMFRMLFKLYGISRGKLDETGGGYIRWTGHNVMTFGDFIAKPEHRKDRNRIIAITVLLFSIIGMQMWLIPHI